MNNTYNIKPKDKWYNVNFAVEQQNEDMLTKILRMSDLQNKLINANKALVVLNVDNSLAIKATVDDRTGKLNFEIEQTCADTELNSLSVDGDYLIDGKLNTLIGDVVDRLLIHFQHESKLFTLH